MLIYSLPGNFNKKILSGQSMPAVYVRSLFDVRPISSLTKTRHLSRISEFPEVFLKMNIDSHIN
jgi:hypothetical protein